MTFTMIILGILLIAGLLGSLGFNSSYIPGPLDEATKLESSATRTATFAGTALDLGSGYAAGGPGQAFGAVVNVSAIDRTDGNETYSFKLQESVDGSTWTDVTPAVSRTTVGAFSLCGFVSARYSRVNVTLGGTTPSVTYTAHLVPIQ